MKKLLLSLVAMWIAFSAHAIDYYLIGGFNNWALAQSNCKFTAQTDGTYVLDYNGTLTSGFKINDGTWGNDAANFGGSGNLTPGVTFNLTTGGSSGNIGLSQNISNPHLVFNPSAKTLLITGQEKEAVLIYGIHGDIFGDPNWSTVNMTESNGNWVLSNRTVNDGNFGIKEMDKDTGSQTAWISADGASVVTLNTPLKCKVEGTNFAIAAGTYTFTFDPTAMTLTVTGTQTGDTPVENPWKDWWVNLAGEFNGNDFNTTSAQPNAEGIATFTNIGIGMSTFELKTWDGSADAYYNTADNPTLPLDTWTEISNAGYEGQYLNVAGAQDGSIYNIKFNCATNEIYVEEVGGTNPGEAPENVYLIGSIVGNAWNPENSPAFTNEGDGIYSIENVELENGGDGATVAYFALITMLSSDWKVVNAHRFGPAVQDTEAVIGVNQVDGEGDLSWSIPAGTYNFVFDFNEMTLEIEKGTNSVETLVAEDGEAVYFNLQGQKVANPDKGIYVKVVNGKAVKVIK